MRDTDIIVIPDPQLTAAERLYLPQIVGGLKTTLRHMFSKERREQTVVQYPEVQRDLRVANYRGVHRLNVDPDGRVACVACFMCSTACLPPFHHRARPGRRSLSRRPHPSRPGDAPQRLPHL